MKANNPWKSGSKYLLIALTVFVILFGAIKAFSQVPAKTNKFVNDYANVIDDSMEETLNIFCKSIEKESSSQVVVITSNDMPDDLQISEWSLQIAQKWGIGKDGVDNGVLILILPNAHKSRIEVGYGLEGILTDGYTSQIQRELFNPNFKRGDFYTGIYSVLAEIKKKISPEAREQIRLAQVEEERKAKENAAAVGDFFINFLIFLLVAGLIGLMIYYIVKEQRKKAAELEKIRQEEERVRLAEERAIREAENSKKNFETSSANMLQKLAQLGDFLNAKELLEQVTAIRLQTVAAEPGLFKEYIPHYEPQSKKIQQLTSDIFSKSDQAKKIADAAREWDHDSKSIKSKIAHSKTTYHSLKKVYVTDLFTIVPNFNQEAEAFYSSIQLFYAHAMSSLKENDFVNAQKHHDHAKKQIQGFEDFAKAVTICESNIQDAHNILNTANDVYSKLLRDADRIYKHSDVDYTANRNYRTFRQELDETLHINLRSTNPISDSKKIIEIHEKLKKFIKLAQADIDKAQKKRDDEERERERLRRKKEREDQEERDRLNNVSTGIAIGSSNWGSNDNSSSNSNDSSFSSDGGSFGGGGSDNSW